MFKKILFVLLLAVTFAPIAFAEGGKNQNNNPVFEEGCIGQLPKNIDEEKCTEVSASDQSGMIVFYCVTDYYVVCNDE